MSEDNSYSWILCENCGKKLLKRKPNGIFVFRFGRDSNNGNVVDIEIFGSVKIKCFRENCKHENIINFFPS